ncbi:c-type cytochrome [Dechloromonas sp. XY25]|uniref:C-type cytochrome n=1 Tax=Dechloromonas hankyongensis TaxID=2908002 RepID=A0ABS9K0X5_9RHOO|nr:c-type cytochrome [Dechloromonas hankyongensis]MCG2576825.1 c-type cytochrome [Dechloromonas hankyongensis]
MKQQMQKAMLTGLAAAATMIAMPSAQAADGEAIVKKARCVACHAVDQKRVGPAYKEVAAKYKGDAKAPAALFDKVRHGGSGNWGQVPMIPHPADKISDEDLKAAIHWVLSLD